MSTIRVRELRDGTTEGQLHEVFGQYGRIDRVVIKRGGEAFVEYRHRTDAKDAAYSMHRQIICGAEIKVDVMESVRRSGGRVRRPFHPDDRCYECGERGHYGYDCEVRRRRQRQERQKHHSSGAEFSSRRCDRARRHSRSLSEESGRDYRSKRRRSRSREHNGRSGGSRRHQSHRRHHRSHGSRSLSAEKESARLKSPSPIKNALSYGLEDKSRYGRSSRDGNQSPTQQKEASFTSRSHGMGKESEKSVPMRDL
ncbi:hypothetical protein ACOME3_009525 [Neoechinorhynchus agilis]